MGEVGDADSASDFSGRSEGDPDEEAGGAVVVEVTSRDDADPGGDGDDKVPPNPKYAADAFVFGLASW